MVHVKWRRIHKWIFVFMGAILLVWLLSGMVMLLPPNWFGPESRNAPATADFRVATLAPAEAIARLEAGSGEPLDVIAVRLQRVQDQLLYAVRLRGGEEHLVDARTGARFEFSRALAEQVARAGFGIDAPLAELLELQQHDSFYPWGDLPVFRLRFADKPSDFYLVDQKTARVTRSSTASRIRQAVTSLHHFQPVESLTGSAQLGKALLMLTSVLGLLGVVSGYYLVFAGSRRKA